MGTISFIENEKILHIKDKILPRIEFSVRRVNLSLVFISEICYTKAEKKLKKIIEFISTKLKLN